MQIIEEYFIYITTNKRNSLFYTGLAKNLTRRTWQHKYSLLNGFTKKYNLDKLIYYENFLTEKEAVNREKQIKKWSRIKKINLIKTINPEFRDLSDDWQWFIKK